MLHPNVNQAEVKRMVSKLKASGASRNEIAGLLDRADAGYNPPALREYFAVTMQFLRSGK